MRRLKGYTSLMQNIKNNYINGLPIMLLNDDH